eukprot:3746246-Rhodomonas_salina.1
MAAALPCTNCLPICRQRRRRRPGPAPTVYPSVYHDDGDGPAQHQLSTHVSTATTTTAPGLPGTNCLPICLPLSLDDDDCPAPTVYPSVYHNDDDGPARHQQSAHLSTATTTTALPGTHSLRLPTNAHLLTKRRQ